MSKVKLIQLDQTTIELIDWDRWVNYPNKKNFSNNWYCLFLDSSNLTKNWFDFSSKVFINEIKDNSMWKWKLNRWDLVMNTRWTLWNIWIYNEKIKYNNIRINSWMLIIRWWEEYDQYFLYSFFRSNLFIFQVINLMSWSVQKQLPIWIFNFINVPKIDIIEQKKISKIIYLIDSKIELNNKINSELEKMAKTLYDYWFVQFDFPNENWKPYKSNGWKMVWSDELKREIPVGWGVEKMKDLLKKNNKKFILNWDKHDIDTIDLSVMPSWTMCLNEKSSSDKFWTNLFNLNKYDILFWWIRPYLLKAWFSPFDWLVTWTVHSFSVKNAYDYNFVLITMIQDSMFNFAVVNSKWTKMPVIWVDDLLEYKVAYNESIVKKYNEILSFKEIISKNIWENQKLAELRDFLLPMLMNWQVSVK